MATKKTAAKKPITTMAKASPIKQVKKPVVKTVVKPAPDTPSMKAYKIELGKKKDANVAAHAKKLADEGKKHGYSRERLNLYENIISKGNYSGSGVKDYNFKTGQFKFTDPDNMYLKGSSKAVRNRVLTADGKKIISTSGRETDNSNKKFPSGDFKNQTRASMMNDEEHQMQHAADSVNSRQEKEFQVNRLRNYKYAGQVYGGLQDSQIPSGVVKPKAVKPKVVNTKKADSAKVVVKKKTPLKQIIPTTKKKSVEINPKDGMRRPTPPKSRIGLEPAKPKGLPPGTKTDGDMSKLDKYGRTPSEARIHAERLSKMTPADHAEIKAAGKATSEKLQEKRRLEKSRPQRPTRTVAKMKKC